jgi:lipoyl(octanoyl) transferase
MIEPRPLPELWICHLGTVAYRDATAMQEDIRARRWAAELPDVMLLLEHPPTYTRGRRSGPGELPFAEEHYRRLGFEVLATDRGGRVTYHGPGQLVGYPIVAVDDVVAYVRELETVLIAALADEGIDARSRAVEGPDFTGVWVGERKIASIGVHVSRGVATHGFAINVDNDLEPFSWIVPCGLAGVRMTSLASELSSWRASRAGSLPASASPLLDRFRDRVCRRFCELHGRRARTVTALELGIAPRGGAVAERRASPTSDFASAHSGAAVLRA